MQPGRRIRVYLADAHSMFLEAMIAAIRGCPGLELVGWASNGEDAAAGVRELRPDVAVLDMRLRQLTGEDVLRATAGGQTRVVFLSAHIDSDLVYRAVTAGAAGYLSKNADREAICATVAAVARGEVVLSPEVQDKLAGAIRERTGQAPPRLTPRERAILELAAEGCSTREIAMRLHVASATVKTHLQSIYIKLDVPDRTSAVAAAIRRGLVE